MVQYKNNWIPTKTIQQMAKATYDVLIVGSGPGGGQRCLDCVNYGKSRY